MKNDQKIQTVTNPFTDQAEALRYNEFRPAYQELLVRELKQYFLKNNIKIDLALDLACGTGHSTAALKILFPKLKACDASTAMLDIARNIESVEFFEAKAEKTPFLDSEFNFINVSMAYQWFDQNLFLIEMRRVLKDTGILCLDNYGFTGECLEYPNFKDHFKSVDRSLMPAAPRNLNYPSLEQIQSHSLSLVETLKYSHNVALSLDQFVNYLMTRSNFQILPESDKHKIQEQLIHSYRDLFTTTLHFKFSGEARIFQFNSLNNRSE